MEDVASKVCDILEEHLGVGRDKLVDDAKLIEDLGAESLDIVELCMAFEEDFGVEIPDDEADKVKTVGDAVKAVQSLLAAHA